MALEDYKPDMERCSQCSYCKWIPLDHVKSWRFSKGCPSIAYNNFNSYSARGRFAVALSLINGESDYTDKVRDIVFKCVTCGIEFATIEQLASHKKQHQADPTSSSGVTCLGCGKAIPLELSKANYSGPLSCPTCGRTMTVVIENGEVAVARLG